MPDAFVAQRRRAVRSILTLLGLGVCLPWSLSAQAKWDATPFVGMYIPLGPLVSETGPEDDVLRKRHVGTPVVGARTSVRLTRFVWIEGTVAYTPSMVAVTNAFSTVDKQAGVMLANVRLPLRVVSGPTTTRWAFHIAPGFGVVSRTGGAWQGYDGATDLAAVFGAGAEIRMANSRAVLRVEAEDYITWASFDTPRPTTTRLHHDLVWTVGLALPVVPQ